VSLWAGSVQELSPAEGDLAVRFNVFSDVSAFTSANWGDLGVLPHQLPVSNSGWTTPIGSFGGVNYYYLEVDLSPLSLAPVVGQQVVLGAAFGNVNVGNPYAAVAQGALGGPFGGDSYIFNQLGYFGSSEGFLAQYGFPPVGGPVTGVTNLATRVSTVPGPSAVALLAFGGLASSRRRR
jgi:MYXO-CTERM domain-containing protein